MLIVFSRRQSSCYSMKLLNQALLLQPAVFYVYYCSVLSMLVYRSLEDLGRVRKNWPQPREMFRQKIRKQLKNIFRCDENQGKNYFLKIRTFS